MKLEQARAIAEDIKAALKPYCERIEIAGSIRREKPEVGDIEIVCIPKMVLTDDCIMFPVNDMKRHPGFIAGIDNYKIIKGKASGKYACRLHPSGIQIDFFMAEPENWGYIFAIRTGSARFSHEILANTWVRKGFKGSNGMLTKGDKAIPIYEEEELFEILGLEYVEPRNRGL